MLYHIYVNRLLVYTKCKVEKKALYPTGILPISAKKGCVGAPDWIIEVVSQGSRKMDCFTRLFKYRTAGVREYWLVDPDKNRILVYNFESEDTGDYSFADTVQSGIYPDLVIDFGKLNI